MEAEGGRGGEVSFVITVRRESVPAIISSVDHLYSCTGEAVVGGCKVPSMVVVLLDASLTLSVGRGDELVGENVGNRRIGLDISRSLTVVMWMVCAEVGLVTTTRKAINAPLRRTRRTILL